MDKSPEKTDDIHAEKTAAEMLKAARTTGRRKRELPTIARQLCIREEFLEALENGEYKKIPELVYILGFARNYAMELELDPELIVQKIKNEMGVIEEKDEVDEVQETAETAKSKSKSNRQIGLFAKRGAERTISLMTRYWKLIFGVIVAAAIIIAGVVMVSKIAKSQKRNDAPTAAVPAAQPVPDFKIPVKESLGAENKATAAVVLQANAETWLKVEDNMGQTLFSRVMMPGDVYYAPATTTGAKATVGNAGGLDVYVNGKPAPKLGADHTRKSGIVLTPDALMPTAAPAPTPAAVTE